MILETIRAVADALDNATYGVNAQLASVPLDAGDSTPTSVATITDATRDYLTAVGRLPQTRPCLTVALAEPVTMDGEVMQSDRNGEVDLIIRYGMDDADTEQGVRDTFYTLRAVVQSLRDFNSNDNASDRQRNGIMVLECTNIRHLPPFTVVADDTMCSGLFVTFRVRDTQP